MLAEMTSQRTAFGRRPAHRRSVAPARAAHRRDLCGKPQLREPIRRFPGRAPSAERGPPRTGAAARSRRQDAAARAAEAAAAEPELDYSEADAPLGAGVSPEVGAGGPDPVVEVEVAEPVIVPVGTGVSPDLVDRIPVEDDAEEADELTNQDLAELATGKGSSKKKK